MQSQLVNHLFKLMMKEQHALMFSHFLHGYCLNKITKCVLAPHSEGKYPSNLVDILHI